MNENGPSPVTDISEWAEGAHERAAGIAEMLGVAVEDYTKSPISLLPNLQNYVDRLPLQDFEQSDWVTLHTDLSAYLGDLLVLSHNAEWVKVDDPSSPVGYRYLIQAEGTDGEFRQVEPFDVVMEEFEHLPIEIGRMIANSEEALHLN
ncbi:hypothetical protein [Streptomyces sp. NPDC017448]|uniref:hypothetical protein n=1 Tax=Streptomyces sp. NPDC017448 TaxID=3364996 RepID=UPI003789950D